MGNRIYCYNCGSSHEGKETVCKQCGKKLDTKHLDFESFCRKTLKGKAVDKADSKGLDIAKEWILSTLYKVSVTVAAVFAVVSVTTTATANSSASEPVRVECEIVADVANEENGDSSDAYVNNPSSDDLNLVENTSDIQSEESSNEEAGADNQETVSEEVILSNNIEDYTIEYIDSFVSVFTIETEYYLGPSEAFDIYKDIAPNGMDMGHPIPGSGVIVYGQCTETGWWLIDLGRSGSYPELYVPMESVSMEDVMY